MSYLVLARKYRPRDFAGLVGQEHVVRALANALTRQRLHHAYLFTGTRGVGKTTVSRILAKALNCTGPDGQGGITAEPCGVCAACRDIDAGRHVDYVELDAASNRGVEEIGRLLDQAVYKPVVGRFKVYMIDEVHMLSNHAFNAMLKTLEEPPEYLKFVLATTDPQKVPPTVLSRCLQFNLRPMALHTLEEHLADVLARESVDAEAGALRLIARAAQGSMRDALSLADQAIAHGAGALAEDGVRQMLGAVDRGHAVRLVEALARRDGRAVIDGVEALRSLGLSAAGTLEEMAALLQQMAVAQAAPDALDRGDPDAGEARRLAPLLAPDETQLLYSIVLHGRADIALAPDEYGGLVMVLLRLLAFAPAGAAEAALPEPPAALVRPSAAPLPAGVPQAARPLDASAREASPAPAVPASPPGVAPARAPAPAPGAGPRDSDAPPAARPAREPAPWDAASAPTPPVAGPAPVPAPGAASGSPAAPPPARPPAGDPAPSAALLRGRPAATARVVVRAAGDEPARGEPPRLRQPAPAVRRGAPAMPEPPPWIDAAPAFDGDEPALGAVPPPDGAPGPGAAPATRPRPGAATPWDDEAPAGRPAPVPAPAVPATDGAQAAAPPGFDRTPLGDRWENAVRALVDAGLVGALTRELALQSECVAVDEPADAGAPCVWRLRVEREALRLPAHCERLQAALAASTGRAARVEVEPGAVSDTPARRDAAERERRQREAEQAIRDDPVVRGLLQQFPTARIVPGTVRPA